MDGGDGIMNKLKCELCGGVDFVRTDEGMFQCQFCGCKYTLDQAKTILSGIEVRTKAVDFEIVGGVLNKYNGENIDVVIPDNVLIIGTNAFQNLAISSVTIPNGVKEIEPQAFSNCKNLKTVSLSDELVSIGEGAFDGCSSLTEIVLPKGITSIKQYTFRNCKSLTSVILPEGLKMIHDYAFDGCKALTDIRFPESLQAIGICAFRNCRSLSDIRIPEHTRVGGMDFYDIEIDSYENFAFRFCNTESFQFVRAWEYKNRCKYCGGKFKGLTKRFCTVCGREKDY